ncbi:Cytochrome c-type biogenesis protein CcdA [Paenibacillus sp. P22]|nr:Cytochrome c-type biogenesis protein CcdA [Paenibacillus sp. P22]
MVQTMSSVNIGLAFAAGIASFVSPCCLPLYPSYLSYITGISVTELKSDNPGREVRRRTMSHTLFFILGFSLVYYTLGYGTNRFAEVFADYQDLIRQLSAILIMLMGLFLIGLFQPKALMRDFKMPVKLRSGYLGSFIFGIGFSAGWSPCVGPILAAILALAASDPGTWFGLTTAYALGFAIPFFVLAFFYRLDEVDRPLLVCPDEDRRRLDAGDGRAAVHEQDVRHHDLSEWNHAGMAAVLILDQVK